MEKMRLKVIYTRRSWSGCAVQTKRAAICPPGLARTVFRSADDDILTCELLLKTEVGNPWPEQSRWSCVKVALMNRRGNISRLRDLKFGITLQTTFKTSLWGAGEFHESCIISKLGRDLWCELSHFWKLPVFLMARKVYRYMDLVLDHSFDVLFCQVWLTEPKSEFLRVETSPSEDSEEEKEREREREREIKRWKMIARGNGSTGTQQRKQKSNLTYV